MKTLTPINGQPIIINELSIKNYKYRHQINKYQSNLVVTGGDAKQLLPYLKGKVDYQPNLVLDGLALGVVYATKL